MDKAKRLFSAARSGEPISKIRDTAAAEDFFPAALDRESDKAARILRSFFIDGYIVPYKTLNRVGNEV